VGVRSHFAESGGWCDRAKIPASAEVRSGNAIACMSIKALANGNRGYKNEVRLTKTQLSLHSAPRRLCFYSSRLPICGQFATLGCYQDATSLVN
jgi:hypothetical protein